MFVYLFIHAFVYLLLLKLCQRVPNIQIRAVRLKVRGLIAAMDQLSQRGVSLSALLPKRGKKSGLGDFIHSDKPEKKIIGIYLSIYQLILKHVFVLQSGDNGMRYI